MSALAEAALARPSANVKTCMLGGSTAARSCIKQTALWLDVVLASLKVTWTWWCNGGPALLGGELLSGAAGGCHAAAAPAHV